MTVAEAGTAAVIPLALRFRRVRLHAGNYTLWRVLLLGWRALHAVAGGILFALLYGFLWEWRTPSAAEWLAMACVGASVLSCARPSGVLKSTCGIRLLNRNVESG